MADYEQQESGPNMQIPGGFSQDPDEIMDLAE